MALADGFDRERAEWEMRFFGIEVSEGKDQGQLRRLG